MNYVDQPRKLQVEIGNFCNAECLGCVRTSNNALQRIEHEGHFFVEPDAFKNILSFGDLIHKVHPLAGQGFNMTIRDIKSLSNIISRPWV